MTGSCYYLEGAGRKFLVDCGMEQGPNYCENEELPVAPGDLDFVLLTHAHMDHSGNLPALYAKGLQGPIYATDATCNLCDIMLVTVHTFSYSRLSGETEKDVGRGQGRICSGLYNGRRNGRAEEEFCRMSVRQGDPSGRRE